MNPPDVTGLGEQIASQPSQVQRVAQSSIELHRDAKGAMSWTLKRYYDQENPFADLDAFNKLQDIDKWLRDTYLGTTDLADQLQASITHLEEERARNLAASMDDARKRARE